MEEFDSKILRNIEKMKEFDAEKKANYMFCQFIIAATKSQNDVDVYDLVMREQTYDFPYAATNHEESNLVLKLLAKIMEDCLLCVRDERGFIEDYIRIERN